MLCEALVGDMRKEFTISLDYFKDVAPYWVPPIFDSVFARKYTLRAVYFWRLQLSKGPDACSFTDTPECVTSGNLALAYKCAPIWLLPTLQYEKPHDRTVLPFSRGAFRSYTNIKYSH
jgi:hypothetical protein